ncbi:MAG: hypothetical protein HRU02_09865 [Myxococcales bacterium]|nr:hypothetical protein [Myxococcales bacterium]
MNRDSLDKLRVDRRLIGRRGWISHEQLARELEMLPDAQEKATTLGDATDGSDSPPPQDGGETPAA